MTAGGARDGSGGARPRYMAVRAEHGPRTPNGHRRTVGLEAGGGRGVRPGARPGGGGTTGPALPGLPGLLLLLGAIAALGALLWAVAAALVWIVYRLHGGG